MQRKSFGAMQCPIACSLKRVGEWWSILILRDALHGLTRCGELSLGIAPNMLTRRLNKAGRGRTPGTQPLQRAPATREYLLT
jgi:DNA-binding HxlR family transcriptional regulator